MGSLESVKTAPRISFSTDFLEEKNFISITPNSKNTKKEQEIEKDKAHNTEFEFLSNNSSNTQTMITADELFSEGKLIPFWEIHHSEKLNKISLKKGNSDEGIEEEEVKRKENTVGWFLDDDPSPRPPKCTVLWKELLKLKKQKGLTLSQSSSSSSSSSSSLASSSASSRSVGNLPSIEEGKERPGKREKHVKRIKRGLERTRSANLRIRPLINVPICTQRK